MKAINVFAHACVCACTCMCVCHASIYCASVLIRSWGQLMPSRILFSPGRTAAGAPRLPHIYWVWWEKVHIHSCSHFIWMMQDLPWLKIHWMCNSWFMLSCLHLYANTSWSLSLLSSRVVRFVSWTWMLYLFHRGCRSLLWSSQRAICIFHFVLSLLHNRHFHTYRSLCVFEIHWIIQTNWKPAVQTGQLSVSIGLHIQQGVSISDPVEIKPSRQRYWV